MDNPHSMTHFLQPFGAKLPVIQASMAGIQGSALAMAVCHAGGLGSLPASMMTLETLEQELQKLAAIHKPYNVNFFCHTAPTYNENIERAWRQILSPYYQKYGITPHIDPNSTKQPGFTESIELLEHYNPPIVSFHFGLPKQDLVNRLKERGTTVIASATTVEEALYLEESGVDAVIAQGLEAGGHRGHFLSDDLSKQMGTLALLPQIVATVSCPVIAAGGISTPADISAAMNLGASAVQIGTAYLLCPETHTSALYRAALKSTSARHTAITNLFSGRPARSIVNKLIKELGAIRQDVPAFPLARQALADLRALAEQKGDTSFSAFWCGQNTQGCQEVSATVLTQRLCQGL